MRIVTIDIETAPGLTYTWGLYKQTMGLSQVVRPPYILGVGYKWHGKPVQWTSGEGMIQTLWEVLDAADVVVHYNGQTFDIPHIQREIALADMPPPSPFAQVDLIRTVRKQFRMFSNKLDHQADQFLGDHKMHHEGFDLWVKCMEGDRSAWARMEKYCKQDVKLTERLHDRLLPWIPTYPNVNVYEGTPSESRLCPRCGSSHVQKRGLAKTQVSTFQQYQCRACSSWFRASKRVSGTDFR